VEGSGTRFSRIVSHKNLRQTGNRISSEEFLSLVERGSRTSNSEESLKQVEQENEIAEETGGL